MDTITVDAASGQAEDLRRQLDELRRQNARLARSIRRQRCACMLAGAACLAVAVGGPAGFRTVRARPVPPPAGIPYCPPAHLTRVGRFLIGVHNINYAFRSQNGLGWVYFSGREQPLNLNADETAQLYATAVQ